MTKAQPKLVLSASRNIPFNQLVLSQANVRRIKAGVSVEELAEDIARRTLLQSLNVRLITKADGTDTGLFEIPAGGRRYRALELLVKQKRLAKDALVPCIVRTDGLAEEDSLAENIQRAPLHPLDQFRAFLALREAGLGEEEIAARFFVTPAIVRQRLKLAAVSPKLLDFYAEDEMNLEQLMAFTVTADHARQEQIWDQVTRSSIANPYHIRRLLTESAVAASDKRARFVGVEAYEAAGGLVLRDLFQNDDGGWLQDVALLDRLVTAKLQTEAVKIAAEGWKWIQAAAEFPYGHTHGMRHLVGEEVAMTAEEQARRNALEAELTEIEERTGESDELPEETERRIGVLVAELEALDGRPRIYKPAEIAQAGGFIFIDSDGGLTIVRGYVRKEDESVPDPTSGEDGTSGGVTSTAITIGGEVAPAPDEDDGVRPLSDRLVAELTAERTLMLREALAENPDVTSRAVLHALCLQTFYQARIESCLEITARSSALAAQNPALNDGATAKALGAHHEAWLKQLPSAPGDLWEALAVFDADSKAALLAFCVATTVNAVCEPYNRRPYALAHADVLAQALGFDLAAHWTPTVANYLGRVSKARILDAVREAKGDGAARLIEPLKKPDMAREAERLLAGTGWLPEPLRMPEPKAPASAEGTEDTDLPEFLAA